MKKGLKFAVLACAGLMLAACAPSQGIADKINSAATTSSTSDDWTYDKCVKQLGTPTVDATASVGNIGRTGVATWYVGCKTADEATEKYNAGKTVKSLAVTFANGVAKSALWSESTKPAESK